MSAGTQTPMNRKLDGGNVSKIQSTPAHQGMVLHENLLARLTRVNIWSHFAIDVTKTKTVGVVKMLLAFVGRIRLDNKTTTSEQNLIEDTLDAANSVINAGTSTAAASSAPPRSNYRPQQMTSHMKDFFESLRNRRLRIAPILVQSTLHLRAQRSVKELHSQNEPTSGQSESDWNSFALIDRLIALSVSFQLSVSSLILSQRCGLQREKLLRIVGQAHKYLLRDKQVCGLRTRNAKDDILLQNNDPNLLWYNHNDKESLRKSNNIYLRLDTARCPQCKSKSATWQDIARDASPSFESRRTNKKGYNLDWPETLFTCEHKRDSVPPVYAAAKDALILQRKELQEKSFHDILVTEGLAVPLVRAYDTDKDRDTPHK
ncbi:hypothetical protein FRC20_005443 [Serendipita sp. 405]|nr:hypothetical protein FRC15_006783 [Serendipita sp. 397]KAG8840730.1 hypothetical protein FRC20_005443 [Serendipita sp. 405]